jgi:hypothetical protein
VDKFLSSKLILEKVENSELINLEGDKDESTQGSEVNHMNDEMKYNLMINDIKNNIYEIKKELGKIFVDPKLNEIKQEIKDIIKQTDITKFDKNQKLVNIFKKLLKTSNDPNFDFKLQHIANEVINDNIEDLLLNNLITSDVFNPNEIISRNAETILLNIDDIKKWIKKYTIIE